MENLFVILKFKYNSHHSISLPKFNRYNVLVSCTKPVILTYKKQTKDMLTRFCTLKFNINNNVISYIINICRSNF